MFIKKNTEKEGKTITNKLNKIENQIILTLALKKKHFSIVKLGIFSLACFFKRVLEAIFCYTHTSLIQEIPVFYLY